MADDANPRAVLGANHPPADDPFPAFHTHISDLFDEARHFLDGEGIQSDGEAEAVSKLLDLIRTAGKDADKARVAEKRPFDDAAKEVQAKWSPLLDRAALAVDTCKRVLAPWLQKKEAEAREAAEAARIEATRQAEAARQAMAKTDVTDLAAREHAEGLVKDARAAEAAANRAEKVRPQASGGGRATTLRKSYRAEMQEPRAALAHYMVSNPDAIKACLQALADTDVREGKRQIPGFVIHEDRAVV